MGAKIVSFWVVSCICRVGRKVFMRVQDEGLSSFTEGQKSEVIIYSISRAKSLKFRGGKVKWIK